MSHTPAPWTWIPADERIVGSNDEVVVYELNTSAADAQLISAAPDLLAALVALRGDSWRHTVDWGPREEREAIEAAADAAIAKASPPEGD